MYKSSRRHDLGHNTSAKTQCEVLNYVYPRIKLNEAKLIGTNIIFLSLGKVYFFFLAFQQ